jgi:amino acid transporter
MGKKISVFSLGMLIIAAIDSIRNLPMAALFGSSLIVYFILAAVLFLFPVALVSAQLTSADGNKGGIYHWVYLAFGDKWALLAIWLQWINTMIWYPTILSFLAGSLAYLIDPDLANHPIYMVATINAIFWLLTVVSFKGIHFSAKISSIFSTLGTVIPMLLVILFGIVWVIGGYPVPISFNLSDLVPRLQSLDNCVSLTAIMASFLGMELAGVHINDVANPQKNFPKVLLFSATFILLSMLFGSLSIAVVIPENEISLVSGVMQFFQKIFEAFFQRDYIPWVVLSIVIGGIGGMFNWLTSPAKGLLHASEFGYLPKIFCRTNDKGVPLSIMVAQAIIVSVISTGMLIVPSINTFYWFFTVLSTNLYMLMYVMLFISALRLQKLKAFQHAAFRISRSPWGLTVTALCGLIGCLITVVVGFFPPQELGIQNRIAYMSAVGLGMVVMASLSGLLILYKQRYNARG